MPTIQTEINRVRDNSNVDSTQYTDTDAILDFNKLLREMGVFAKENWDTGNWDLVNGQNEYKVDVLIGTPNVDILNVDKLYLNYGGKLVEATYLDYYLVDKTSTDYTVTNPVYTFKDSSVFIYPTPTVNFTNGFQSECKYLLKDYLITDNVEDIPLGRNLLDVMFRFGFEEFIESTVRNNKANAANLRDRYKQEMQTIINETEQMWPDTMEINNNDRNHNYMY